MRILHVVTLVDDNSSYGGPLTVAINQCRELRSRGHDAQILAGWAGQGPPPSRLEGIPAHLFRVHSVLPGMRFSGLFSLKMLFWLAVNARSIEIAHLHAARDLVPLSAGAVLRLAKVEYTTQTHGMVVPDERRAAKVIDYLLTLRVLRNAKARFVLTDHETTAMLSLLGSTSITIHLPNGVALNEAVRTPVEPLDILFMARLHPRKRVMDFAAAALTLVEEGHPARFSVVGPDEGELPDLLAFIALHPSLAGRLCYEGPIAHDDAVARLSLAGVFVLPSVNEPFPMTLLEALAVGIPCVCTTSCGMADDLIRDDAGLVIKPGAEPLTAALRTLIENSDRRAALSQAGRKTARTRYSMDSIGNQLLKTYEDQGTSPSIS